METGALLNERPDSSNSHDFIRLLRQLAYTVCLNHFLPTVMKFYLFSQLDS